MTKLLINLFIKDNNNITDNNVRTKYGYLSAFTGIVLNILLFIGKFIAGIISGTISVTADAFNNLSDAGSSIMTFIGFKMASMPADNEHPFGHGRMEYVTGIIISFIIMMMGFELGKSSIEKIFSPEESKFSIITVVILSVSILFKLWMCLFNRKLSKITGSGTMKAVAMDSLSDCISTSAVLITIFIFFFTGINLDAYAGVIVSLFILYTGYNTFRDSLTPLLGTKPSTELVKKIEDTIMSYPLIVGIHDLMVHDYGANNMVISLHAEVPCKIDINEAHEIIDLIEDDLRIEYRCLVTIHMDPVEVDDEETLNAKAMIVDIVSTIDESLSIHDFRMTKGNNRNNLIFDLVTPFNFRISDEDIIKIIVEKVNNIDSRYFCVVKVERAMI